MKRFVAVATFAAVTAASWAAFACMPFGPAPFETSESEPPDDSKPPAPELELEFIGEIEETCLRGYDALKLEADVDSADDAADEQEVGFVFEVVGGHPPAELELPDNPVPNESDQSDLAVYWGDPERDESKSFSVRAYTVDKWGRRSGPSNTVEIKYPPESDSE